MQTLPLPATAQTPRTVAKDHGSQKIDPRSLPALHAVTNLDFDVTENCNLGCIYCFKGEMYSQHMSLDTMKKSLDWLLEASGSADTVNVNFMGGEPTMRWKQIKEFLPWARRRGQARGKTVSFSMTTNLTLWNDDIREIVDLYGFGVLMSIDGCPEVQDAQRPAKNGRLMSDTVEHWAKSMLRSRPRSTARATIHPKYVHKYRESMDYLRSIGFREVAVSLSDYSLWTQDLFGTLQNQVNSIVDMICDSYQTDDPFNLTVFKYYIKELISYRARGANCDIKFQKQPCGAGRGYMMVDYTGDIWPCHRFDGADTDAGAGGQFRFGNIFEGKFNSELQRVFLDFDHESIHKDSCTKCPVNPVCGGYCPAANLSDTGSIYTPHDTFCFWSQLNYYSAKSIYDRLAPDQRTLDRLMASCEGVGGDGQK